VPGVPAHVVFKISNFFVTLTVCDEFLIHMVLANLAAPQRLSEVCDGPDEIHNRYVEDRECGQREADRVG
jgi:hypothetical protein